MIPLLGFGAIACAFLIYQWRTRPKPKTQVALPQEPELATPEEEATLVRYAIGQGKPRFAILRPAPDASTLADFEQMMQDQSTQMDAVFGQFSNALVRRHTNALEGEGLLLRVPRLPSYSGGTTTYQYTTTTTRLPRPALRRATAQPASPAVAAPPTPQPAAAPQPPVTLFDHLAKEDELP